MPTTSNFGTSTSTFIGWNVVDRLTRSHALYNKLVATTTYTTTTATTFWIAQPFASTEAALVALKAWIEDCGCD